MTPARGRAVLRVARALSAAVMCSLVVMGVGAQRVAADSFVPVNGAGSTWSANALNQWIADVQQEGMRVNYAPTGSSDGRHQFLAGTVDFAATDIPFQSKPEDGSAPEVPAPGSYAYMPITAGGTVFMYNLHINGQRVTNLRLSGQNIAKIFTGVIKNWNDPALAADNPGLHLPSRPVVPVVRSDGSGSTAQFTTWMISQQPSIWNAYCQASGRAPACGLTSYYPTVSGMIAQSGDLGVAGYVAQNYADGAIGYVNYSYALNAKFPVVKMLNASGYYTEPTPDNVAVSLEQSQIDTVDVNDPSLYLTQNLSNVYTDQDPRTYPLSSYSYLVLPSKVQFSFTTAKGKTLGAFAYYAMCQGQQESASLGYSPMPVNLVQASFDQIKKIPGVVVENITIQSCKNPTFDSNGKNLLAEQAPMPAACDKQGPTQCSTGTGGAAQPTQTSSSGGSTGSSGGATGGSSTGGSSGSSSAGGGGKSSASANTAGRSTSGQKGTTAGVAAGAAAGAASSASSAGTSSSNQTSSAAACDPSTGSCSAGQTADPSGGSATAQAASAPSATPTTLAVKRGWTGTQTLILVIAVLFVALVLGPPVAARYLDRDLG
jgi:phosphate transport system substrate-binding protein